MSRFILSIILVLLIVYIDGKAATIDDVHEEDSIREFLDLGKCNEISTKKSITIIEYMDIQEVYFDLKTNKIIELIDITTEIPNCIFKEELKSEGY